MHHLICITAFALIVSRGVLPAVEDQAGGKSLADYVNSFIACVRDYKVHPTRDGYGKTFSGAPEVAFGYIVYFGLYGYRAAEKERAP